MDHGTFERLLHEVRLQPFAHGKRHILTSHHVHAYFNGHQIHVVLEQFIAASDKVEVLAMLSARLLPMSCHEAAKILSQVPFAKDKLALLELLARLLSDGKVHHGREQIRQTFTFHGDKDKAEDVLTRYHGPDPHHHHHHHRPGFLGAIVDAIVGIEEHCHEPAPPAVAVVAPPPPVGYPVYAPPPVVYPTVYVQPQHHHHGHHHHGHHHGHH